MYIYYNAYVVREPYKLTAAQDCQDLIFLFLLLFQNFAYFNTIQRILIFMHGSVIYFPPSNVIILQRLYNIPLPCIILGICCTWHVRYHGGFGD